LVIDLIDINTASVIMRAATNTMESRGFSGESPIAPNARQLTGQPPVV
jgi:hypothetical protein